MITENYKKQLSNIHKKSNWGANSRLSSPKVHNIPELIKRYNIETLIDFGCGQGGVHKYLEKKYNLKDAAGYDPCVKTYEVLPQGVFDMLISLDVLEHIEPDFIDDTLKLINNKFKKISFLNIHTSKAKLILPDGRNAHLIQEQPEWWKEKISQFIEGNIIEERWLPFNEKKHKNPVNYLFVIEK